MQLFIVTEHQQYTAEDNINIISWSYSQNAIVLPSYNCLTITISPLDDPSSNLLRYMWIDWRYQTSGEMIVQRYNTVSWDQLHMTKYKDECFHAHVTINVLKLDLLTVLFLLFIDVPLVVHMVISCWSGWFGFTIRCFTLLLRITIHDTWHQVIFHCLLLGL